MPKFFLLDPKHDVEEYKSLRFRSCLLRKMLPSEAVRVPALKCVGAGMQQLPGLAGPRE